MDQQDQNNENRLIFLISVELLSTPDSFMLANLWQNGTLRPALSRKKTQKSRSHGGKEEVKRQQEELAAAYNLHKACFCSKRNGKELKHCTLHFKLLGSLNYSLKKWKKKSKYQPDKEEKNV